MKAEEFAYAFNDMFSEIKPMSSLVRKLSAEKNIIYSYFPIQVRFILKTLKAYDYISLLDKYALSYKLKALKPGPEIYRKALTLFNSAADECIFIDDLKDNYEAAEERNKINTI